MSWEGVALGVGVVVVGGGVWVRGGGMEEEGGGVVASGSAGAGSSVGVVPQDSVFVGSTTHTQVRVRVT